MNMPYYVSYYYKIIEKIYCMEMSFFKGKVKKRSRDMTREKQTSGTCVEWQAWKALVKTAVLA